MEEFVIVVVCLILNGLFACFEMAFVTVTKPQLRQVARSGDSAAKRILALRENPERTLSVIQIGITLVGMISAAVGGAGAEESFAPVFEQRLGLSENSAEALAIISVVVPLTLFSVVLGEIVPKTIALRDPLRISMMGAKWISGVDRVFSPLVTVLEAATKLVLNFVPKRKAVTVDAATSVEIDHLSKQTQQYVLNLVGVETRKVKDVMVPWSQVNFLDENDDVVSVTASVIRSGHTRLPVCREGKVIGLLHTKEFIAMVATTSADWHSLVRPVIKAESGELALRVLRQMQERRSHFAIVEDAGSSLLGIVTLEDIIEEIVGELFDEDDDGRVRKVLGSQMRTRSRI